MTTHTFVIAAPDEWINANDRLHWREAARRTKSWREAAGWTALRDRVHFTQAHVTAELHFKDNRHRDAANWYPTVKACIDGIVGNAKVMPNDSDRHLLGLHFAPAVWGTGFVGVRLTFTTELPASAGGTNNSTGTVRAPGASVGLVEGRQGSDRGASAHGSLPGTGGAA